MNQPNIAANNNDRTQKEAQYIARLLENPATPTAIKSVITSLSEPPIFDAEFAVIKWLFPNHGLMHDGSGFHSEIKALEQIIPHSINGSMLEIGKGWSLFYEVHKAEKGVMLCYKP